MCWESNLDNYICEDCKNNFQFEMDTLYIASHGGLPIKCPKCKSQNIKLISESTEKSFFDVVEEKIEIIKNRKSNHLVLKTVCKECGFIGATEQWIKTEVYCEECGSHSAEECPECGKTYDLCFDSRVEIEDDIIESNINADSPNKTVFAVGDSISTSGKFA